MRLIDRGLYCKYKVIEVSTGEEIRDRCFVLLPQKDPAAVKALQAYAAATGNKPLADDLYKWVGKPAPTIDAAPVRHGYWIPCNGKSHIWYCSECDEKINYNQVRRTYKKEMKPVWEVNKRCRSCGAKMDGGAYHA